MLEHAEDRSASAPIRSLVASLLPVISLWLAALTPALAGESKIVLEEHLDRQWTGELLTYHMEFPEGERAPDSISLTGPNGLLAVQLSDIVLRSSNKSIKSASVSFVIKELKPLETRTYTLTWGTGKPSQKAPDTDLKATTENGKAELATGRIGIRLLLGEGTYANPQPADKVPGPIQGLRLPDGTWSGGSQLQGPARIKSWSSKLTTNGPVFAQVDTLYTYADGNTLKLVTRLNAGDYAALQEMEVSRAEPEESWELLLTGTLRPVEAITVIGQRNYTTEARKKIDPGSSDPVCSLCSWPGDKWFPDNPSSIRFPIQNQDAELQVSVRDPGAWVEPQERPPWANFTRWTYEMIGEMWSGWRSKLVPLIATKEGARLRFSLAAGRRKWSIGVETDGTRLLERYRCQTMSVHSPLPRLNEVKEMVLAWPDGEEKHPYLFMNREGLAAGAKRNPEALKTAQSVGALRGILGTLGTIDLMRRVMAVASQYDAIVDSKLITPQQRKLIRAQTAYLAYVTADPFHWSFERGCCSGNPNMTASRAANLGLLGCALRDHPLGRKWAMYAIDWTKYWLTEVTDETGGWPESSHYARVSWSDFVQLAIAARKAGYHDFFADPKFRAMSLFYEKTLCPPDPLRQVVHVKRGAPRPPGVRTGAPYGRGTRGDAWGLSGLLAAATSETDPAYSRQMQWSWRESGFNGNCSHNTAGMSSLYGDRGLPAEAPDWGSEYFPSLGYLLRSHVGTPQENYLLFVSEYYQCADGQIWPPHTGIIAKWFANGTPMGGAFRRIPSTSHVLLENRVLLACNWDPKVGDSPATGYFTKTKHDAFTRLSSMDYVSAGFEVPEIRPHHLKIPRNAPAFPKRERIGSPPFHWQRQLMLMGEGQPGGINYLVLRDTVSGGQPTQWHFWTLSEKIGTPAEAADREAFLRDRPGDKSQPLRELNGSRFVALGQFDKDLAYFIANPSDTPRYTLRYGTTGGAYGLRGFKEFQDLLHLQLPGDGSYFVALFPRAKGSGAPEFASQGSGKVIRIRGTFGTDYCFLSKATGKAKADEARFEGTAASVQDRTSGLILALAAPGSVAYGKHALSSPIPCSLSVADDKPAVRLPDGSPAGEITLRAPGKWSLVDAINGVSLEKKLRRYVLRVPAGVGTVKFTKAQ